MTDIRSIMLPVTDPRDLAGRKVQLANVEVRAAAGPRAVWIGSAPDEQLLVVADDPKAAAAIERLKLAKGQRIDVEGTLDVIAATTGDSTLANQWGLASRDADMLRLRRVFLRAIRIDSAGR